MTIKPNHAYQNVLFIGAGSLNSWLALALAKQQMFKDATVYDDDVVNNYNHYNQAYDIGGKDEYKINELYLIVGANTDVEIECEHSKFNATDLDTLKNYDLIVYGADNQQLLIDIFNHIGDNKDKYFTADFITGALSLDDAGAQCGNFACFNLLQNNYREAFKAAFCYSDATALEHHPTSPCGGVQPHERPVEPLLYLTSNLVSMLKTSTAGLFNYRLVNNLYEHERLM